jgi:uncharacterized protein
VISAEPFAAGDFAPSLKTRLLVLQPTPFCNIACDYCYLPNRNSKARMSIHTMRTAARRLRDDDLIGSSLSVIWHAGEPLVLPPSYFDVAIPALAEAVGDGCRISHSIQTNGTLIDDAWCELFTRHQIRVGVSVDGPEAIHDAHRRTRSGKGTHASVVRGMDCLSAHGIPFHVIAVVTSSTFGLADEFLDFFEAEGVRDVGCNFDEPEGVNVTSSLSGREADHATFIARLLARTADPSSRVRIRELMVAKRLICDPALTYSWRGRKLPDNAQVIPFAIVNVAHDGQFSTFSPELLGQSSPEYGTFSFGNVADVGYFAATSGDMFRHVWSEIVDGISRCESTCAHFGYCGGGAPANKLYENGSFASGETLYCRTMFKRPFDTMLASLETAQR